MAPAIGLLLAGLLSALPFLVGLALWRFHSQWRVGVMPMILGVALFAGIIWSIPVTHEGTEAVTPRSPP